MCTHTSSAHAIRFRHPHGVFTCVRVLHPSDMLNTECLVCLSVVLYNCFYGKWLKCVKCGCYVCKSFLSLCYHNKSIHDLWIMLQWYFGVILIRCFVSLSLRWICKGVLSLLNQQYMSKTYWYFCFSMITAGGRCCVEEIKKGDQTSRLVVIVYIYFVFYSTFFSSCNHV